MEETKNTKPWDDPKCNKQDKVNFVEGVLEESITRLTTIKNIINESITTFKNIEPTELNDIMSMLDECFQCIISEQS